MIPYLRDVANRDYDELRSALVDGNLILFAGSGLSAQATTDDTPPRHPPLWKGLLESMVRYCVDKHWLDSVHATKIRELIDAGYLIDAGQELQETLEPHYLRQCIGEVTLCNEAKTGKVHELIAQIPFRAYLTTNYDEFIEGAYLVKHGVKLQTFYEDTIEGVSDAFFERRKFIIKLHGDINLKSPLILGERSYQQLMYTNEAYSSILQSIFFTSSILFVGFSASDPDIERIMSKFAAFNGRSKRHWILLSKGSFPLLRAERLWKDKGIITIQYERDDAHTGLLHFLEDLSAPPSLTKP